MFQQLNEEAKVVLLCGPPGTGKVGQRPNVDHTEALPPLGVSPNFSTSSTLVHNQTTLAHVVARHAGYQPLEINASDDRSVEALRERITAVTQTQEVFNGERRPKCLILDEIDGSTKEAIALLVRIVQGGASRMDALACLRCRVRA